MLSHDPVVRGMIPGRARKLELPFLANVSLDDIAEKGAIPSSYTRCIRSFLALFAISA
jgi:hypothetical protein